MSARSWPPPHPHSTGDPGAASSSSHNSPTGSSGTTQPLGSSSDGGPREQTPKVQGLRVRKQPREGSRDHGYLGTQAEGASARYNPLTLPLIKFPRPVGQERRETGYLVLPSLKSLPL